MSFDDADDDGAKKRKQAGHMQEIHDAVKRALAARSGPLWRSEAIISSPDHDAYDEYDPFGVDAPLMPCADTMDSLSEFVHSAIAYRRRADKTEYAAAASGALGDQDPRAQEAPPTQVAAAPAAVITRKGKGPTGATAKAAAAPASASLDEDADGGHGAVPAPASKAGSSPRVTNPKGGIQGRAAAAPAAKAAPAAAAAAAAAAVEAPAAGSKRRRAAKDQEDAVDHEERDDGPASASGLAKSSSKAQKKRNDRA